MSAQQVPAKKCVYCGTPTTARQVVVYRLMATDTIHNVPVCAAPACARLHGEVLAARARESAADREG
jgi:hypothetical protein